MSEKARRFKVGKKRWFQPRPNLFTSIHLNTATSKAIKSIKINDTIKITKIDEIVKIIESYREFCRYSANNIRVSCWPEISISVIRWEDRDRWKRLLIKCK